MTVFQTLDDQPWVGAERLRSICGSLRHDDVTRTVTQSHDDGRAPFRGAASKPIASPSWPDGLGTRDRGPTL
jgi:hypothetical protein